MPEDSSGVAPQHQPIRRVLVPVILLDELERVQREYDMATGSPASAERKPTVEYRVAVALERAIRSYERGAAKLSAANRVGDANDVA